MQCSILWALGRDAFDIFPEIPLKVLIIQSENDDEDIAEMRDGIFTALEFSPQERSIVGQNVQIMRCFKSNAAWLTEIEPAVEAFRPDLIIADPLFAFAGVDLKDQAALCAPRY